MRVRQVATCSGLTDEDPIDPKPERRSTADGRPEDSAAAELKLLPGYDGGRRCGVHGTRRRCRGGSDAVVHGHSINDDDGRVSARYEILVHIRQRRVGKEQTPI